MNSVNRITSTIKNTLQKGNNFIRAQIYSDRVAEKDILIKQNQVQSKNISIEQEIKAVQLYDNVKIYAMKNEKVKKNVINILNYAELKWDEFCKISNKSGPHYNECLQKFKVKYIVNKKIDSKLNVNLNLLIEQDNLENVNRIKLQFRRIIEYLNQRARKYIDKNKQIMSLIKKKQKEDFSEQCQEEAIKEEMLELLDKLKGQAINIGSDLKKDNKVISQINQKQDKQLNVLSSKSKNLQQIMTSQKIGFFKLISYAGIAIVVWIFTLLFILIF